MVSATVVPSLQSPRLDSVLSRLFHLGVLPQALEKWLPKALWAEINLLFVGFGQQVSCRDGGVARNALCLTFVYRFAAQSTPTVRRASTARFALSAARHCATQRMLPGTSSRASFEAILIAFLNHQIFARHRIIIFAAPLAQECAEQPITHPHIRLHVAPVNQPPLFVQHEAYRRRCGSRLRGRGPGQLCHPGSEPLQHAQERHIL